MSGRFESLASAEFRKMFQAEINDANTPSLVSGALGTNGPIASIGKEKLLGDTITVNQSQIDKQPSNVWKFVQVIK